MRMEKIKVYENFNNLALHQIICGLSYEGLWDGEKCIIHIEEWWMQVLRRPQWKNNIISDFKQKVKVQTKFNWMIMHTQTQTHAHTNTRARIHTHTHTHTHTRHSNSQVLHQLNTWTDVLTEMCYNSVVGSTYIGKAGKIILTWILKKYNVRMVTGFSWQWQAMYTLMRWQIS